MSVQISIDYPAIPAATGEKIKGKLQEQDILGDFGPGQNLWQHLFGGKKPDMTWCSIIAPDWFQDNYDGETSPAPLTKEGRTNLNTAVQAIYNEASGPITVLCHKHGQNPNGQKELNIQEFNTMLESEGLPYRTLIVLDRRLETRDQ